MDAEGRQRNRLLESIVRDCPSLMQHVEEMQFQLGEELCAPGTPLTHVYFPVSGVLSSLVQLREGASAETMTIGNEGMVGLVAWLGVTTSSEQVLQQAPGVVMRIAVRHFCRDIAGQGRTETLLKRFAAYSLRFGSQNTVCNSHHKVEQRACRWLLSSCDRAGSSSINLTQALLAQMLGVRRQTMGEVAVELQRRGLIRCQRGSVQVLDRTAVLGLSCECYTELRQLYASLVGSHL